MNKVLICLAIVFNFSIALGNHTFNFSDQTFETSPEDDNNLNVVDIQNMSNSIELAYSAGQSNVRTELRNETIVDPFYNRHGCWSRNLAESERCTHPFWRNLSDLHRAQFLYTTFQELMRLHSLKYDPAMMVCKVVHESCMRTQLVNPRSTASGLGQIIRGTVVGIFRNAPWFSSKVDGFQNVRNGVEFHDKMKRSLIAQAEMGLAVFHQIRLEARSNNPRVILDRYSGSPANGPFATRVLQCTQCLANSNGKMNQRCLTLSRASCFAGNR